MNKFKLFVGVCFAIAIAFLAAFPEYAVSQKVARAAATASEYIVIINRIGKGDFNAH